MYSIVEWVDMAEDWDNRIRLLFYGHGLDDFKLIRDAIPTSLKDNDFEIEKEYTYSNVSLSDAESVLRDTDLSNKNAAWLRQVDMYELQTIVDAIDDIRTPVRGFGVVVSPARPQQLIQLLAKFPLPENYKYLLSTAPEERYRSEWKDSPAKNPHAPFSYDPNNDYYTEPDSNNY